MARRGSRPGKPSDTVDVAAAQRFAWVKPATGEDLVADPDPGQAEEEPPPASFAENHATAAVFGEAVERAMALGKGPAQAAAVRALCRLAHRLDLAAVAVDPAAALHYARLLARHWDHLDETTREQGIGGVLCWFQLDGPGLGELLVATADGGSIDLVESLAVTLAIHQDRVRIAFSRDQIERLALRLDEGPADLQRLIAARWLAYAPHRAAIPALRRALLRPHLELRWRALKSLLALHRANAPALLAEDVEWLLADATRHALPLIGSPYDEWLDRAIHGYPRLLADAVAQVRPPGGQASLVSLVDACYADQGYRSDLDRDWALPVLAGAYPGEAVASIARFLGLRTSDRITAVEAASRLPEELGRPWLWRGATDGSAAVAQKARELWLERFRQSCPVTPADELDPRLLAARPGPAAESRLQILRGPEAGRVALTQVLLGEAPDPEALALLTVALGDDAVRTAGGALPGDAKGWARRLVEAFGSAGGQSVLCLAERYPGAAGWLEALDECHQAKLWPGNLLEATREVLGRLVAGPHDPVQPLKLLAAFGPDPGLREVLWSRLEEDALYSVDALAAFPPDAELDARILGSCEAALAAGEWGRAETLVQAGIRRSGTAAPMAALAERLLASIDSLPDLPGVDQLLDTAHAWLHQAGRLDGARRLAALADPGSRRFAAMAHHIAYHQVEAGQARLEDRVLRQVLGSPARGGASRAAAAFALILWGKLGIRSRHWPEILAVAPLRYRADLVCVLGNLGYGRRRLWPLARELLTLPGSELARFTRLQTNSLHMVGYAYVDNPTYQAELCELFPRLNLELQDRLHYQLGLKKPGDHQWEDAGAWRRERGKPRRQRRRRR
jgi:hypothetical protein